MNAFAMATIRGLTGTVFATTLLAGALLQSAATAAAEAPCSSPEHRAFDFWVGDWQVHTPDGRLAGHNRIELRYGGCVLAERYSTPHGYAGESLNSFDEGRGVWHQTWVDNAGTLLLLEGGMQDGAMVLEGATRSDTDAVTRQRITWTAREDGGVRQLWETQAADEPWTVVFDGRYRRRDSEF